VANAAKEGGCKSKRLVVDAAAERACTKWGWKCGGGKERRESMRTAQRTARPPASQWASKDCWGAHGPVALAGPTHRRRVRVAECKACSARHGGCRRLNEPA
jgi:hypothetical protein